MTDSVTGTFTRIFEVVGLYTPRVMRRTPIELRCGSIKRVVVDVDPVIPADLVVGVDLRKVLPEEILYLITQWCDGGGRCNFRMTCRQFRRIGTRPDLYPARFLAVCELKTEYITNILQDKQHCIAIRELVVGHLSTRSACDNDCCINRKVNLTGHHVHMRSKNYRAQIRALADATPNVTSLVASVCLFTRFGNINRTFRWKITRLELDCACGEGPPLQVIGLLTNLQYLRLRNYSDFAAFEWKGTDPVLPSLKQLYIDTHTQISSKRLGKRLVRRCENLDTLRIIVSPADLSYHVYDDQSTVIDRNWLMTPSLTCFECQVLSNTGKRYTGLYREQRMVRSVYMWDNETYGPGMHFMEVHPITPEGIPPSGHAMEEEPSDRYCISVPIPGDILADSWYAPACQSTECPHIMRSDLLMTDEHTMATLFDDQDYLDYNSDTDDQPDNNWQGRLLEKMCWPLRR